MTVKEAKEYLRSLERIDSHINQKLTELGELRAMMGTVKSLDYSKEHVQTSPAGEAPYIAQVERMISLDGEITEEIDYYVDEKHRIINQIQKLKGHNFSKVLFKRYVEFKNFCDISEEMGYSYNHIRHLHGWALQEFAAIMTPEEEKSTKNEKKNLIPDGKNQKIKS